MGKAIKLAEVTLTWFVGSIFVTMLGLILIQVINRFILGWPLFWTEEVVRMLLVWSVMMAVPLVTLRREEIAVELGPMNIKGRRRAIDLCSVVFCAFLAWFGYQFFLRNLAAVSPTLGLSRGWFVAAIPLGSSLTILAILARYLPAYRQDTLRS